MTTALRYKWVGSTVSVGTGVTGVSPTPAITGISLTNPAIVTSPAHGLVQGDVARLASIVGATQFNGNLYGIDDVTPNDFALGGYDNSAGNPYTSGGTVNKIAFTSFCELTGFNQQGGGADQEDVSSICSTAKEFEQGLSDPGTVSMDFNFAPSSAIQLVLRAAELSGDKVAFKIVLPNSGGTVIVIGSVQTTSFNGQQGQSIWKGSASIKLSGPIFVP